MDRSFSHKSQKNNQTKIIKILGRKQSASCEQWKPAQYDMEGEYHLLQQKENGKENFLHAQAKVLWIVIKN